MIRKPALHGRDHRPGGADPIPGLPPADAGVFGWQTWIFPDPDDGPNPGDTLSLDTFTGGSAYTTRAIDGPVQLGRWGLFPGAPTRLVIGHLKVGIAYGESGPGDRRDGDGVDQRYHITLPQPPLRDGIVGTGQGLDFSAGSRYPLALLGFQDQVVCQIVAAGAGRPWVDPGIDLAPDDYGGDANVTGPLYPWEASEGDWLYDGGLFYEAVAE